MPDLELVPIDIRRKRLLYRATHRGTFENDLMIGGFLRLHLESLTDDDLTALEAIMDMRDDDLAEWLTGRAPIPDKEDNPMLPRIRDYLRSR